MPPCHTTSSADGGSSSVHAKSDGRADVQHDDGARECALHGRDQSLFRSGEVIAAGTLGAVTVFSRGASDEYDGDIASFRRLLDDVLREGHLGVGKGPVTPKAGINGIFRSPIIIEGEQDGVEFHSRTLQSFDGGNEIWGAHVAAGAVADIEPIRLHPAEEGDSATPRQEGSTPSLMRSTLPSAAAFLAAAAMPGKASPFTSPVLTFCMVPPASLLTSSEKFLSIFLKKSSFPPKRDCAINANRCFIVQFVLLNFVFRLFLGFVRAAQTQHLRSSLVKVQKGTDGRGRRGSRTV